MVKRIIEYNPVISITSIVLLSLMLHINVFQKDLIGFHVWRQTETQTVINNYIHTNTAFQKPLRNDISEKNGVHIREFPLMQWIFAQIEKPFEKPYIVSRILTFCISILSIIGIFLLAQSIFNERRSSLIAAWSLTFSPIFYYYCVNPLPDNLALCLSLYANYFALHWNKNNRLYNLFLSLLLLSLATLVKLPYILTGGALFYFIINYQFKEIGLRKKIVVLLSGSIAIIPGLIWYIYSIPNWDGVGAKNGILDSSFSISNTLDIISHNLISTLPELFINYGALPAFVLGMFVFLFKKEKNNLSKALFFQLLLLIAYFLFEHNMIGKVHDYYLLPFLPIIILTIVYGYNSSITLKNRTFKYIILTGILILPITAYLRIHTRWNEDSPGFNSTYYSNKNEIRKILPNNAVCVIGPDESKYILLYYINRKGFTYDKTNLDSLNLNSWIKSGATHFITSEKVDQLEWMKTKLKRKIYSKNEVNIYEFR